MEQVLIEPVEGRKVRDPLNGFLPITEATTVPRNSFWARRIAAGDVKVIESKAKAKPQPKSKK